MLQPGFPAASSDGRSRAAPPFRRVKRFARNPVYSYTTSARFSTALFVSVRRVLFLAEAAREAYLPPLIQ